MAEKNAIHAKLSFCHTRLGTVSCLPNMARSRFLPNSKGPSQNAAPMTQ